MPKSPYNEQMPKSMSTNLSSDSMSPNTVLEVI